jgi:hypothetical protein
MSSPSIELSVPLFANVPEAAIKAASGSMLQLPPDLSSNQRGNIIFSARFARLSSGGELRSVHIYGPRIEIINLFHFPSPNRALPIYAMEFVLFGSKPIVGVIDAKPLHSHPFANNLWQETLTEAHAAFPDLITAEDPPPWYEECRSGLDFFTRPNTINDLQRLLDCHVLVWARLAAAEISAPLLDEYEAAAHSLALDEYKNHHRINSPGLPFLHRTFGLEWTDNFLRTALFA